MEYLLGVVFCACAKFRQSAKPWQKQNPEQSLDCLGLCRLCMLQSFLRMIVPNIWIKGAVRRILYRKKNLSDKPVWAACGVNVQYASFIGVPTQ